MRPSIVLLAGLAAGLFATASQAADLPRRKAYSAPEPVMQARGFNWTGGYVGATAGYGWGSHSKGGKAVFGKPKGAVGGVTAGYNMQYGSVVAGVEGDLSLSGESKSQSVPGLYSSKSRLRNLATARARIGVAADRALIYATGGYAGGSVQTSLQPAVGAGYKESKWLNGYAVGAGVEYAATDNVTVKGEYLYTDLGSKTFGGAGAPQVKTGFKNNLLRAGVNYKF